MNSSFESSSSSSTMHHRDSVFEIGSNHYSNHEKPPTARKPIDKKTTRKTATRYATRVSLSNQPSIILNAKSSPHPLELLNAPPGTNIMLSPTEIALMITKTTRRSRRAAPKRLLRPSASTKAMSTGIMGKQRESVQDAIDTRWELVRRGLIGARQTRYDLRPRPLPARMRFG